MKWPTRVFLGNGTHEIHSASTYWVLGVPQGPLDVEVCLSFLGELENAQSTLQRCLELDPTSVDAHLLMSHVYLAQGNFAMCSHCLELGVSHNFQVGVLCARSPRPRLPKPSWPTAPTCPGRGPRSSRHPSDPSAGQRPGQARWASAAFSSPGALSSSREPGPHTPLCSSRSETTPSTTWSRPGPSTSVGTIQKP